MPTGHRQETRKNREFTRRHGWESRFCRAPQLRFSDSRETRACARVSLCGSDPCQVHASSPHRPGTEWGRWGGWPGVGVPSPVLRSEEPGEIHPGLAADKSTTWEICAQTVFQAAPSPPGEICGPGDGAAGRGGFPPSVRIRLREPRGMGGQLNRSEAPCRPLATPGMARLAPDASK